jgi:hypothetical protein
MSHGRNLQRFDMLYQPNVQEPDILPERSLLPLSAPAGRSTRDHLFAARGDAAKGDKLD